MPGALPCPNCGCEPGCDLVSDDFSANTIANYTQVSGSWSIGSGKLDPPASGLLKINQAAPVSPDGTRVKWMFNFASNTGTIRIIVDYVDADNYHYCEVICSDASTATIRLWERDSTVETALEDAEGLSSFTWSNDYSVAVCWTGERLRASIFFSTSTTPIAFTTAAATDLGGDYAGVSVVTAHSSSRFDNMLLSTLADGCADCPPVCGPCSGAVPVELQVDISGMANGTCGSCASLDGVYVLPFNNYNLAGQVCTWIFELSGPCTLDRLAISVEEVSPGTSYDVEAGTSAGGLQDSAWNTNLGAKPDCDTFDELSLSSTITGSVCDGSAATVLVTTL
jgi:hypothetical protein